MGINIESIIGLWLSQTPISLVLVIMVATAFLVYGLQIFVSRYMRVEYKRFGMSDVQRKLVGILQVAGAMALLVGIGYPLVGFLAAFGFAVMMLIALFVRWRIKDSLLQSIPAIVLLCANMGLCFSFLYWVSH